MSFKSDLTRVTSGAPRMEGVASEAMNFASAIESRLTSQVMPRVNVERYWPMILEIVQTITSEIAANPSAPIEANAALSAKMEKQDGELSASRERERALMAKLAELQGE